MRVFELEKQIAARLAKAGAESPGLCARLILRRALGLDDVGYMLSRGGPAPAACLPVAESLARRRELGEPMAYILGRREFYGRGFAVSPATLVPRPETELLAELALKLLPPAPLLFADLGAGSGCLGLTLVLERPAWSGFLLEKSRPALEIAEKNRRNLAPCSGACLVRGDIFALPFGPETLDLIVANPPYIGRHEADEVCRESLAHEPPAALFSGNLGLAHIAAIAAQARSILRPGGLLLLEHGFRQGKSVRRLLAGAGFAAETARDLAGLDRCAIGWKNA